MTPYEKFLYEFFTLAPISRVAYLMGDDDVVILLDGPRVVRLLVD